MRKRTPARLIGSLVLAAAFTAPPALVHAAGSTPAAAPPSAEVNASGSWRRYALPLALTGAGLGIATSIAFKVVTNSRQDAFNNHDNPRCSLSAAGKGGPPCAALLDDTRSAQRWSKIGLGMAGAFAATALVLWWTEPVPAASTEHASGGPARLRLACAPGAGLNASCVVAF